MAAEFQAIALADFTAEDAAELSFEKGSVLTILATTAPEGWYLASNSAGKRGLVPQELLLRRL